MKFLMKLFPLLVLVGSGFLNAMEESASGVSEGQTSSRWSRVTGGVKNAGSKIKSGLVS